MGARVARPGRRRERPATAVVHTDAVGGVTDRRRRESRDRHRADAIGGRVHRGARPTRPSCSEPSCTLRRGQRPGRRAPLGHSLAAGGESRLGRCRDQRRGRARRRAPPRQRWRPDVTAPRRRGPATFEEQALIAVDATATCAGRSARPCEPALPDGGEARKRSSRHLHVAPVATGLLRGAGVTGGGGASPPASGKPSKPVALGVGCCDDAHRYVARMVQRAPYRGERGTGKAVLWLCARTVDLHGGRRRVRPL